MQPIKCQVQLVPAPISEKPVVFKLNDLYVDARHILLSAIGVQDTVVGFHLQVNDKENLIISTEKCDVYERTFLTNHIVNTQAKDLSIYAIKTLTGWKLSGKKHQFTRCEVVDLLACALLSIHQPMAEVLEDFPRSLEVRRETANNYLTLNGL